MGAGHRHHPAAAERQEDGESEGAEDDERPQHPTNGRQEEQEDSYGDADNAERDPGSKPQEATHDLPYGAVLAYPYGSPDAQVIRYSDHGSHLQRGRLLQGLCSTG